MIKNDRDFESVPSRNHFACLVFGILIVGWMLLSVCPCLGETMYRWENDRGDIHYSNISPPQEVAECQVIPMGEGKSAQTVSGEPAGTVMPVMRVSGETIAIPDHEPEGLKRLLIRRITKRKNEIHELEQGLRRRVNDQRLRRNLMRKKRYLAEDLRHLAELKQ